MPRNAAKFRQEDDYVSTRDFYEMSNVTLKSEIILFLPQNLPQLSEWTGEKMKFATLYQNSCPCSFQGW